MKPPQNLKLCTQLTTRMYIREIRNRDANRGFQKIQLHLANL